MLKYFELQHWDKIYFYLPYERLYNWGSESDGFFMPVIRFRWAHVYECVCVCVCVAPVLVYLCVCVCVCACVCVEAGEGGFIINQGPSLSVRAAQTPWLNDWKWAVIMGCQSSPWHPPCSSISWVHVVPSAAPHPDCHHLPPSLITYILVSYLLLHNPYFTITQIWNHCHWDSF